MNIFLIFSILASNSFAQAIDTISTRSPLSPLSEDSLTLFKPIDEDSLLQNSADSLPKSPKKISKNSLESTVKYDAVDSIIFNIKTRKAYLFNKAVVIYDDMELRANYIELDFKNNELYASGIANNEGEISGHPVFIQNGSTFRAKELKYNFNTRKGKISEVITVEGEGFIHGEQIKKLDDNTTFIKKGKYTTCELDHPHFEIAFVKAKVIPNEKIITGPAYLNFGGVPTILAIPFGYFPLEKERRSGIVMPTFGESSSMGFYFENFGYYFGINDNLDLLLGGDIYTRGSWGVKAISNYVFRYKCNGQVNIAYKQNRFGEKLDSSFYKSNDFKLYWKHQQDAKSHPTTRFSALINIISKNYNKYNTSSISDYLSNQYTSSVNFSTNAKGFFFLDAALNFSQNTQSKTINFKMPDLSMSINQFYPFRKRDKVGPIKWYDNISMKWSSQLINQINCADSSFFEQDTWDKMELGMKHTIPLTIPIKIAKLINWNTNVTFTEKLYLQSNLKEFTTDTLGDILSSSINTIFQRDFYALHDLSLTSALTTKIYFMYQFKKSGLRAIRHVMTPNLNFTYHPNLSGGTTGTYFNTITGEEVKYSYFDNSIFGGVAANDQAIAQFSLSNNIEMKVRSKKDTITGTRKIVLFDNLTLSTSYDFAADSLNWAPLRISGRTTLFKQIYITFNLAFDPYIINENGKRIHQTEWKVNKRFWRFSSSDLDIGLNWRIDKNLFKGKKKDSQPQNEVPQSNETAITENTLGMPISRPDFNNPWSFTISYKFSYSVKDNYYFFMGEQPNPYTNNIIQTLNITGDVNITKKWKVGFTTGYDFMQKELSYTSLDIYRDLHCWEMRFNWIPFGNRKGWSFTINVKASVLQDLKYNMKSDFRDNF